MSPRIGWAMLPPHYEAWETPQALFDELDDEFHFTLDPCSTKKNAKCKKFYTEEDDGLAQSWAGERVFMNPPYSKVILQWTEKAYVETHGYWNRHKHAELVVGLLPAATDTHWFHYYVYHKAEIRFLFGRLKFEINGMVSSVNAAFPSMIVIWRE